MKIAPPADAFRHVCRNAASEALLPRVFCRIRRCRRSRRCLGRFAAMILTVGGPCTDLPLCVASVPLDQLHRFCDGLERISRTDDGHGGHADRLARDAPDERPWPWPPIRLHPPDAVQQKAPRHRTGWLRRPRP